MSTLETVDFEAVEILAAGGPIRGRGSPPGGDYYTTADLQAIVDAHRELGSEVRPVARLGHDRGRAFEQPAVGWLERLRVSADGKRLLADVRRVPRRVADAIRAGAYRTRSLELSRVTSQRTGRVHSPVVTGLAWLGSTLPAVQTLDDVVALYEAEATPLRVYSVSPASIRELEQRVDSFEDTLRRVHRLGGEPIVAAAVADGRIEAGKAEFWLRGFERSPDTAKTLLGRLPADPAQAARNYWTPERDEQARAQLAARLGMRVEDVI